ncbi:ERC protein 2 isoform X1 [Leptopilina heterotoma]|uniref:ERC protein 2 isoform X1 n=1 Tax=Leptopilina heterotoma TaxID=63436 RepID=UPI001CA98991|nr:ERC protein 2 isoform X1 [Leptopilina heterotoma]XP_043466387.1 ERC protein 2 isoform X1 [Leptopilina heterotoma]XP_043466388.1 ERC protein 2 isoform X1 [Leptopilina heterotoma]
MDSVAVTVPLRPPVKKMKKRKELDALAPHRVVSRRCNGKRRSQELLSDSSDECSELWNVSTRGPRKSRNRSQSCPGLIRACSAFLACAAVLATASLIWLFIDVRQQLTTLRSELDQVIAGSEGLPDAIQKCDSTSKQLQKNQSIIFTQLSNIKTQLNNLTDQITAMQRGLQTVQESLKAEPQLASIPKDFMSLQTSVAKVGSEISDLKPTVDVLKDANKNLLNTQNITQQKLSSLQTSLQELMNATQKPQLQSTNETNIKIDDLKSTISQLARNLTIINQNITARLDWARDEQAKDHSNLDKLQDKAEHLRAEVETLRGDSVTIHEQINALQSRDSVYNKTLVELKETCNALQKSQTSVMTQATSTINNSAKETLTKPSEMKEIAMATDQKNLDEKLIMKENM